MQEHETSPGWLKCGTCGFCQVEKPDPKKGLVSNYVLPDGEQVTY